jgi:hypothetical protein
MVLPPPGEQGGAGGLGMASPWFVDVVIDRESPTGGYEHCAADRRRKIGASESDCISLIVIKAISFVSSFFAGHVLFTSAKVWL